MLLDMWARYRVDWHALDRAERAAWVAYWRSDPDTTARMRGLHGTG
jgi:hypothetical protein